MCFSIQIDRDRKKLAKRFQAEINEKAYRKFAKLKEYEKNVGLQIMENQLGLKHSGRRKSPIIKEPGNDDRVYSNYFTSVMIIENGKRIFEPMRYRIRPKGTNEEIPSKYNVFNARIDSLESRRTWKNIFMKSHGLIPFKSFYEWVEPNGKKKLINFTPENHDIMWAPCLWDEWESSDKQISFKSFAILTDDPPKIIAENGHDRCPIFLREDLIDDWLLHKSSKDKIYQLLKCVESDTFDFAWAA